MRIRQIVFFVLMCFFIVGQFQKANAQVAKYFSSGHYTTPNTFTQASATLMTEVPTGSGSWRHITTSNGTGNRFYRYYSALAAGTTFEPNGASDIQVNLATSTALQVTGSGKAWFIGNADIDNGTSNYVFKTDGLGTPGTSRQVVFRVQGAVRTISTVSKSPASPTSSDAVTVTATISGTFATGQGAYLRYSTNGWSSSTVVSMSGAATTYTGTIPAQSNCTTISYYVFTSGDGLTISSANADFYTINYDNNGGSNYSYLIGTGCCPSVTCNQTATSGSDYTVNAGQTICINNGVNYSSGRITSNGGKIHIKSGGTLDIPSGCDECRTFFATNYTTHTIENCGTIVTSGGATPDFFKTGSALNTLTINNYGTLHAANGSGNTFYLRNYNTLNNYGTMDIDGKLILDANSTFTHADGSFLTIDNEFRIQGTANIYGDVMTEDLQISTGTLNMYDGSIIRVTANLWLDGNNRVFAPGGGTAYINNTGGTQDDYGSNTLSGSASISYCGPWDQMGSAVKGTSCPYLLPISLISFDAKNKNKSVVVTWETFSEKNNDYFTVQRSVDGIHFEDVGFIQGAGNSSSQLSYIWTDYNPLKGISYYRLKQTDYDGKFEEFKMVAVNVADESEINIFQNNHSGDVFIRFGKQSGKVKVSITDILGNMLVEKSIDADPEMPSIIFDSSDRFAAGVYFVRVISETNAICKKILVE